MKVYTGIGVSPGVAIGKAFVIDRSRISVSKRAVSEDEVKEEIRRQLRRFFYQVLERRPVILPIIIDL